MDGSVILLAESFWTNPASWLAIAKAVLGLGAVIFVHELGHFLLAKMCGVKCDKFYVGFDAFDIKIGDRVIVPRSLVKFQWGETEYGIGILPLGGYVKMLGQDDNPSNIEKEARRSMNPDDETDGEKTTEDTAESDESIYTEAGLIDRSKIDPRSYLAKSVPKRMAIISAGVIFNLIFAVIFAAIAFKSGVYFTPPVIGPVTGSGPAWKQDLSGASIVRIGDKETEGYFPFKEIIESVVFHGSDEPLELKYIPYGETEVETIPLQLEAGFNRMDKTFTLMGVEPQSTPKIASPATVENFSASLADPAFQHEDLIVAVNDTPIKTGIDLRLALLRDADKVVEFTLERQTGNNENPETELIKTKVDPNPMRLAGFSTQWQPISYVKENSPAEAAGLLAGDEIISINSQPRGDLMTLDKRMIVIARESEMGQIAGDKQTSSKSANQNLGKVEFEIKRNDKIQKIFISPVVPQLISKIGPNKPVAIDSLGISIPLSSTVDLVTPNSPAATAGVKVGDEIIALTYLLTDEQLENEVYAGISKHRVDLEKDDVSWAEFYPNFQRLEIGTEFNLELRRNKKEVTAKLKTIASEEFFQPSRGISLMGLRHYYQADTWGDAIKYGAWQTWLDIKRVGTTLAKLVKGELSVKNLGGPGTIAMVATSEASQGTSRLLLFLTLLSANLAIINFLPIPILDGGHMMFLAYEGLFRRPVTEKIQVILTYIGLAMILCLMLFVIFLDAGRYNPFF